jgi:hypothetical protein
MVRPMDSCLPFQASKLDDNDRPTAINSVTNAIPPPDTSSLSSSPQTVLPIIIPSFDESSSNLLQTKIEGEQQSEIPVTQTSSNNNEYINPRGIRFTTLPTNEPVKGREN